MLHLHHSHPYLRLLSISWVPVCVLLGRFVFLSLFIRMVFPLSLLYSDSFCLAIRIALFSACWYLSIASCAARLNVWISAVEHLAPLPAFVLRVTFIVLNIGVVIAMFYALFLLFHAPTLYIDVPH